VIGPALADDKEAIIGQIRQIGAGGGGINVRTGVAAAAEVLAQSQHQVKHLIVLADGADSNEQGGVPELIGGLVDRRRDGHNGRHRRWQGRALVAADG
jgi:hypothetical protein